MAQQRGYDASLTVLWSAVSGGSEDAFRELIDAVYDDLHRLSGNQMQQHFRRPLAGLTRPPTAIVSAAVMRLREQYCRWAAARRWLEERLGGIRHDRSA